MSRALVLLGVSPYIAPPPIVGADNQPQLQDWLNGIPNGTCQNPTRISFPAGAEYQTEWTWDWSGKSGIYFDMNGGRIFATSLLGDVTPWDCTLTGFDPSTDSFQIHFHDGGNDFDSGVIGAGGAYAFSETGIAAAIDAIHDPPSPTYIQNVSITTAVTNSAFSFTAAFPPAGNFSLVNPVGCSGSIVRSGKGSVRKHIDTDENTACVTFYRPHIDSAGTGTYQVQYEGEAAFNIKGHDIEVSHGAITGVGGDYFEVHNDGQWPQPVTPAPYNINIHDMVCTDAGRMAFSITGSAHDVEAGFNDWGDVGRSVYDYEPISTVNEIRDIYMHDNTSTSHVLNFFGGGGGAVKYNISWERETAMNLGSKLGAQGRHMERITVAASAGTWIPIVPAATNSITTVTQGGGGSNELQRITFTDAPDRGTWKIAWAAPSQSSEQSIAMTWPASAATVQSALEGLAFIAPGDVSVSRSGAGTFADPYVYDVTFQGTYANTNVNQVTVPASQAQLLYPAASVAWNCSSTDLYNSIVNTDAVTSTELYQVIGGPAPTAPLYVWWNTGNQVTMQADVSGLTGTVTIEDRDLYDVTIKDCVGTVSDPGDGIQMQGVGGTITITGNTQPGSGFGVTYTECDVTTGANPNEHDNVFG